MVIMNFFILLFFAISDLWTAVNGNGLTQRKFYGNFSDNDVRTLINRLINLIYLIS